MKRTPLQRKSPLAAGKPLSRKVARVDARAATAGRVARGVRRAERAEFRNQLTLLGGVGATATPAAAVVPAPRRTPDAVTPAVRALVYGRAGMCCERCGINLARGGGQCHHRRPRRMGSDRRPDTNQAANILLLCGRCHERTESFRAEARADGLLLSERAVPASVPVVLLRGRVLLADDGTWSAA